MSEFQGRIVVVVSISVDRGGAQTITHASFSEHIGAVCAREFALRGAQILAIDTSAQALAAVVNSVRSSGGAIETLVADPADPSELAHAAAFCMERFGRADVLLNCHHDTELSSVENTVEEAWTRVISFNLLGPIHATRSFLPLLKIAGALHGSSVVHVGSIDGLHGNPQIPAYSTAKGGLIPLTHVMADEFAPFGIRVNCAARGMTVPRGALELNPMFGPLIDHTPLGRPAYSDEVVAAIRFLASPEASYVTGAVLPIDGGRTGVTPGTRPSLRFPHSREI